MTKLYVKPMNQPLNLYECVQLLEALVNNGMITRDEKRAGNIIVPCKESPERPEGWYSTSTVTVARCLVADIDGQRVLRQGLKDEGVELAFSEIFPPKEGEKRIYIDMEKYEQYLSKKREKGNER